MLLIDWIKRKAQQGREAREAREQARAWTSQQATEAERQAEEEARRRRARHQQWQENVLALLGDNKLPEVDWDRSLGPLPFKFMKSEHLVYVFPNVRYMEQRTKREIVGRSTGVSVRVMRGVYMRTGASRGTPVESDEVINRGAGTMAVTTKHLYFHGQRSFRIRFEKMVSVEQFSNGVGVTRDRANAHPEFFIMGESDAWFAYELMHAIPSLETGRGEPERLPPLEYHMLSHDASGDVIHDE